MLWNDHGFLRSSAFGFLSGFGFRAFGIPPPTLTRFQSHPMVCRIGVRHSSQFWAFNPGTCWKSPRSAVSSKASLAKAIAAMRRSIVPTRIF
jgi:hypothetical protein